MHVATGDNESDAQGYYVQDLGYFAAAVAAGALHVGSSNILAIATARARGFPFVFIAPGGQYRDANHLTYPRTLDVAAIAPVLDLGIKYKALSQPVPPAALIPQLS